MKRIFVLIVLIIALGGIVVNAQRPVGDTINIGEGGYLCNPLYATGTYNPFLSDSVETDYLYTYYFTRYLYPLLRGQMSYEDFIQEYPDLATRYSGRHVTGQQFSTSEPIMVIGLAVCPTICFHAIPIRTVPHPLDFGELYLHVVDTTMANREDEYVQFYTIEDGEPQLQAGGRWRWEYPHRYMMFPSFYDCRYEPSITDDTTYAFLYEVMFDTGIHIGNKPYMVAGTHNNNATAWSSVACDTVFTVPKICWEHYPTEYSSTVCSYTNAWWIRRDTAFP